MTKLLPLLFFCLLLSVPAWSLTDQQINQGSIERARQTARVQPTAAMVIERVDAAAALLAKEGPQAFSRFKGAESDFIYAGTYIWVHSARSGKMLMHPMLPNLEGHDVLFMKDRQGKAMFIEFNRVALEQGSGWVDYLWPKPGETAPSRKVSYVKLVPFGKEKFVVGSGVYDISLDTFQLAAH